ncbi:hypothetical protein JCM31739_16370 [Faecalimonas canis]
MNMKMKIGAVTLACAITIGSTPFSVIAAAIPQKKEPLKIGVMSDTHYFSKSLYRNCEDFTTAMNSDRKMLKESDAILTGTLNQMIKDEPDVVMISGDLTKDGEQVNHEAVAQKLSEAKEKLAKKGVDTKFFVINGNHDINNPHGKDFSSKTAQDADRTTVEEFKKIYKEFGYDKNTVQYNPDSNRGGSLSYVTQLAEGYTLIAVDTGKYSSDQTSSKQDLQETGGVISPKLLDWVTEQAEKAKAKGDTVMVVQHHGVIPHFEQEQTLMADYLVDNWEEVREAYADAGVSYVFTGHMHANDIASYTSKKGNTLYDIETGSLVTYPSLFRSIIVQSGTENTKDGNTFTTKMETPGTISYEDFDTGNIQQIENLTEYGKTLTLSNEVIRTMITEGVLSPMIDSALANGGSKTLVADLLKINPEQTSQTLVAMLTQLLPTEKENGLPISVSGFNFRIYYDVNEKCIRISQDTSKIISDKSKGILEIPLESGRTLSIELPEEIQNTLKERIQTADTVEEKAMTIELLVSDTKLANFFDQLFTDVDTHLLGDKDALFSIVETFINQILDSKIDDTHNVFDLVNYVYQLHLAGNESCEPWAETAIQKIQQGELLPNILTESIKTTQPVIKNVLSKINIDLKTILDKGNSSLTTNLVYGVITGMIKNAGDIVDMIDLSPLLPDNILSEINTLAYNAAYSMSHDVNYQEDLDTSILIEGKQKWEDSETPEVPETPETIPPQKPDTPAPQKPQTQQPQNLPTKKPAQPVKTGDTSEISLTLLMLALSTSAIGLLRKRR